MKVLRLELHNVMRVEDIDVPLAGEHLVLVGGRNGQGKTSAIQGLLMALCGRSGMEWPDEPLKAGCVEGWVKVHLSGSAELHEPSSLVVDLHFFRKGDGQVCDKFRILDSAGEESPEPRTLLKRLYSTRAFDPLSFEKLRPQEQRDLLCRLVGVDPDKYERQYRERYEKRTSLNRELKALDVRLGAMPEDLDSPTEEVSVEELMGQLSERRRKSQHQETCRQTLEHGVYHLNLMKDDLAKLQARIAEGEKYVETAQRLYDKADAELRGLESDEALGAAIVAANATNDRVRRNKTRSDLLEEYTSVGLHTAFLTEQMDEIRAHQALMLQKAQWPVDGLSVDSKQVLFHTLPFSQVCKSDRVYISTLIGMALQPELRLLVCEDGSDLDNESLARLQQLLQERDFQMILEMVTRSDDDESRCMVVIEDGKEKGHGRFGGGSPGVEADRGGASESPRLAEPEAAAVCDGKSVEGDGQGA